MERAAVVKDGPFRHRAQAGPRRPEHLVETALESFRGYHTHPAAAREGDDSTGS